MLSSQHVIVVIHAKIDLGCERTRLRILSLKTGSELLPSVVPCFIVSGKKLFWYFDVVEYLLWWALLFPPPYKRERLFGVSLLWIL